MSIEMLQFTIIFMTHIIIVILSSKSYLSLDADFPNFQRDNQVTKGFGFAPTDTDGLGFHENRVLEPKIL